MNLDFLNKNKKTQNTYKKPSSEVIVRPSFLWSFLLIIGLILGVVVFVVIILSYNYLTKEREGIVNENQSTIPRINNSKLQKVESFFEKRQQKTIDINSKKIIDPAVN